MSDVMLMGILKMPLPDNPTQLDALTWIQFRGTALQAAERIEADANTIERLTAELAAARETARRLMEAERVLLADAERYRLLRDRGAVLGLRSIFELLPNEWDEAIDAAGEGRA